MNIEIIWKPCRKCGGPGCWNCIQQGGYYISVYRREAGDGPTETAALSQSGSQP